MGPPRFMTINVCIEQLLQIEAEKKENVYSEDTQCVGVARIGSANQLIVYGTMKELLDVDFGKALHSFVIPGNTHFIEEDVLKMYALNECKAESQNDDETKMKMKETVMKKVWHGIDFNGIWQLEKSENLNDYLMSEGWSNVMIKAGVKSKITQQIIQDCDMLKIKVFSASCSYSYSLCVNGECVKYKDLNGDLCESKAKWSDDKKFIMETISKKINLTGVEREYTVIRGLNEENMKQMTLKYINDKGSSVTRYSIKR